MRNRLPRDFYLQPDVVAVSRQLLGKVLCSRVGGLFTSGIITETEAYCGRNDKACHANNGLRTDRTEIMYGQGGHAYVYLCYGIHHLFNIVTNRVDMADAVLIRSLIPIDGADIICERRNNRRNALTDGPGKLSEALGIHTTDSGTDLLGNKLWVEDRGLQFNTRSVKSSPRIGVEYAGEDAKKPWRFTIPEGSIHLP